MAWRPRRGRATRRSARCRRRWWRRARWARRCRAVGRRCSGSRGRWSRRDRSSGASAGPAGSAGRCARCAGRRSGSGRTGRDDDGPGVGGAWPSGKARDFGSRIRRFESSRPNHIVSEAPMSYELKLFSGNANRPLAEEIAQYLHVGLGDADVSRFSDGEVYVQINENVRGQDVFVIQPTCPPVNDHLMELLVMLDAFKRASAQRITAVLPYYGYGRQDRKVQPRVPITAQLVADLHTKADRRRVG